MIQVCEFADVMNFHVVCGAARLASLRQKPLKQLGASLTLAGKGQVFDVCRESRSQCQPAEAGDQRFHLPAAVVSDRALG
jgi:hypothetical protein